MIVESWCVGVSVPSRVDIDHTFWGDGRKVPVFIYYGLVHGLDHDLVHGHGPVLGVVVGVDLGWTCGWTCDAPRDDPPLHTR